MNDFDTDHSDPTRPAAPNLPTDLKALALGFAAAAALLALGLLLGAALHH